MRATHPDLMHLYEAGREAAGSTVAAWPAPASPYMEPEPLYGLSANGVKAETRFLTRPPAKLAEICELVLNLVGKSFPEGFNHIDFDFHPRVHGTQRAYTISDGNRSTISIGLILSDDLDNDHELHGKIAYLVFHEIFLHALPDLRTASFGEPSTTEQEDHDIMLVPPDETNALHQAVKAILPGIPENIKQYFLDTYVDDVEVEKSRNDSVDEKAAEAWHQLLDSQLNNVDSAFWSARPE